ncbi:hypothetical protein [Actinorhabdospora filicis]|nr:hypothetical protein [Actinorhabdospora filicis]
MSRWIRPLAAVALLAALVSCTPETPDPEPSASNSGPAVTAEGPLKVSWTMPSDFAESSAVALPMVIADDKKTRIAALKNVDTIEAVMTASYALPQDFTGATDEALKAKIAEYDTAAGVTPQGEPILALASRHKGFVQVVTKSVNGKTVTFEATYLFFGPKLVQVICQWDKQESTVRNACQTVLRSLQIS